MIQQVIAAIGLLLDKPTTPTEEYNVTDGYSEQEALTTATRVSLAVLIAFTSLIAVLSIAIVATVLNFQPIRALGVTERIHLSLLTPERNPRVYDQQVLRTAKEKGIILTSINFSDYKAQLAESKNWFSGEGWNIYINSLKANKVIETVEKDGLVITSIASASPILMRKFELNGKMNWQVRVPIYQTIQGPSKVPAINKRTLLLTMEEARRDESPDGLMIREFTVSDR